MYIVTMYHLELWLRMDDISEQMDFHVLVTYQTTLKDKRLAVLKLSSTCHFVYTPQGFETAENSLGEKAHIHYWYICNYWSYRHCSME